jgi:serine/threonine-protein kinase
MGVVYRGRHRDLQADRAVKLLPPHLAADDSFVARFKREATIAAGLRHPNIVLIYDVGQEGDYHYIVMELVAGRSLRDVIRADKPLSIARIVRLLQPLADALDFAHKNGVIHRDVKPSNVIVGRDDKVTLLDFGIARAMEGAQQLTRAGLIVGTPEYMAPEVVTGGRPGANADLYALGVVAYELLTGHVPFHGVNTTAVAYAQVHTPPPSPRADRADLPDAMEGVLLRQLAKDQNARYPDARSFVRALERGAFEDAEAGRDRHGGGSDARDRARETWVGTESEPVRPLPHPRTEAIPSSGQGSPRSPADRATIAAARTTDGGGASGGASWLAMLVAVLLLVILGGYGLLAWGVR